METRVRREGCDVSEQGGVAVRLDRVSFAYGGTLVLEDVSISVARNEFLCIVGPNGGGKTTIVKLILGLLKPLSGSVTVLGQAPERARSRIGYVPQRLAPDPLFPVSALDVVLMGTLGPFKSSVLVSRGDRERALDALNRVEMTAYARAPYSTLSGGQAQRVLLARALATDPDMLVLDEPTSNIDTAGETEFHDFLASLVERMTIVLVTHDLGFVSRHVSSVACVNRRLVCHPTCELTGETIGEMYGRQVRMVRHDAREGGPS